MATYWQYRLIDGVFTGAAFGFDPDPSADRIEQERHFGCGLWCGQADPLRQRVDVGGDGQLVPWRRPAPPDTALTTWAWDEAVQDYLPSKTLHAQQLDRVADVDALLTALDLRVPRLAGEIAEALALGEPVPTESRDRLVALNLQKAELRTARAAMLATTTLAQLQAIVLPTISADPAPV